MGRDAYPCIAAEEAGCRALWSLALEDGALRERLVAAATYLVISGRHPEEWPPELQERLQELRASLTRADVPLEHRSSSPG